MFFDACNDFSGDRFEFLNTPMSNTRTIGIPVLQTFLTTYVYTAMLEEVEEEPQLIYPKVFDIDWFETCLCFLTL